MAQYFCWGCQKEHDDYNWKSYFEEIEYKDGVVKKEFISICTKFHRPDPYPEFTTNSIKEQRSQYLNSIIQPWRDGVPSKEFAEAYPDKAKKMFKDEYKKAQYVWKDQANWNNRHKTK